ncbi:MotA/TolQ/ExbB proton channel family protein [Thalassolituus sp. LLYu03]|uniref:MotA/TolQ/ExbB proton channel family protein n=1 Tax=Thalassolituus sp. LLYu03 TaxID=3421656 RepID=UPI003D2BA01D
MQELGLSLMHNLTGWLLQPVIWALLLFVVLALYETGIALGERTSAIRRLVARADEAALLRAGKKRVERADFIARIAPMLGLMGTLIPLGPGLAALGDGDFRILTTAMTVAFDTTVVGLLVGIVGFVLGRVRRRWYDNALAQVANRQPLKEQVAHD